MKFANKFNNNRGSGIVTVLIAIVFLTAFGSALLILSYTGLEMRSSDSKGKKNLYDASGIVEQMNAGVQTICSEAIVNSYSNTMPVYEYKALAMNSFFQDKYRSYIVNWKDGTEDDIQLIVKNGSQYLYNPEALKCMIVDDFDGEIEVTALNASGGMGIAECPEIVENEKPSPIVLKDLSVSFSKDGRNTRVITDIIINYPSVGYTDTSVDDPAYNDYACVVRGKLKQEGSQGQSSIYGGAYFGGAELTGSTSQMIFDIEDEGGTFIIDGDLVIDGTDTGDSKRFVLNRNEERDLQNELWVKNIEVQKGTAVFDGIVNVADDLTVDNRNSASVVFDGEYNGFGYDKEDPDKSSAVIINGKRKSSDERSVVSFGNNFQSLTLAGFAFAEIDGGSFPTSESISSKENQKIYLLPPEMVYYIYKGQQYELNTMPEKMDVTKYQSIKAHTEDPSDGFRIHDEVLLWEDKHLSDYGVTTPFVENERIGSGNVMVYAWAKFDTDENANAFFRDYISHNPQKMNGYVENYVKYDSTGKLDRSGTGNLQMAGGFTNGTDYFAPGETGDNGMEARFERLKTTLGQPVEEGINPDDPVAYILSTEINDVDGFITFRKLDEARNPTGPVAAIVANGDVTIGPSEDGTKTIISVNGDEVTYRNYNNNETESVNPDDVYLILASGNITVNGYNYNGLIVAGGNLELQNGADLNKDPARVTDAYKAQSEDYEAVTDYMNTEDTQEDAADNAWDVTNLVVYRNWRRDSDDD